MQAAAVVMRESQEPQYKVLAVLAVVKVLAVRQVLLTRAVLLEQILTRQADLELLL
jgi:hypothetical protein